MFTLAIQYVKADNDGSGNPRRGYLVTSGAVMAYFIPEGFDGVNALYKFLGDGNESDGKRASELAMWLPAVATTAKGYRDLVNDFPHK